MKRASPAISVSALSTAQSSSACNVSVPSSTPLNPVAPSLSSVSPSPTPNSSTFAPSPNKNNNSFTTINSCPSSCPSSPNTTPSSLTTTSSSPTTTNTYPTITPSSPTIGSSPSPSCHSHSVACPSSSASCSSSSATDSSSSPSSSSCSSNYTACTSSPATIPSLATCISSSNTCPSSPTSCSCSSSPSCTVSPTTCTSISISCTSSSATCPYSNIFQSTATNCSAPDMSSAASTPSPTTSASSPTICQPPSTSCPSVSATYPSTNLSSTSPTTPSICTTSSSNSATSPDSSASSPVSSATCSTTSTSLAPSTVCPPTSTAVSSACTTGPSSSTTTSSPSPVATSTTSSPIMVTDMAPDSDTKSKSKEEDTFSSELEDVLSKLREMTSWSHTEATEQVKKVDGLFWKHKDHQKELADAFCELQGADLWVTMLLSLNKEGVFSKNQVWQTAFYIYNTAWNLSDSSLNLVMRLGQLEMIRICSTNISHKPYLNNMSQKNVLFLIKASLNILHNLAKCPGNRHYYRTENVVEKLETFMEGDPYLKAISMMTLAYIVEEGQEAMLDKEGRSTIEYLVRLLMEAQNSKDKRSQGLSDKELTAALGRLAVHDNNKVKISDAGGIPLIFSMLGVDCRETQEAAAKAIWNLTFSDKVCRDLKGQSEWLDALKSLSSSDHMEVAKAAKGSLWKINKDEESPVMENNDRERHASLSSSTSSLRSLQKKPPHIMLSYQWNAQPIALQIRDALVNAGYRIWVDVDCMYGSTLQAMAEAIENACAIIMCMSESYKESPNCRTEAEYAFQLQKRIIPVKLEEHYRPDGWLGIILGAKFYMDFSGCLHIEQVMRKLIREVEIHAMEARIIHSEETDDGELIGATITFPLESAGISSRMESLDWSSTQVQDWLSENELEYLRPSLAEYNGRLLNQLYKMRREAPEFFYASIKEDFGLKRLIDVLKFTDALDVLLKDS